jgi:hypothetical protein
LVTALFLVDNLRARGRTDMVTNRRNARTLMPFRRGGRPAEFGHTFSAPFGGVVGRLIMGHVRDGDRVGDLFFAARTRRSGVWDDHTMSADLQLAMTEFQRCIAERDGVAAAHVLDADFALVLVHPVAAVVPRDRWLATLPDYAVHSYDVQEQLIDVDGNVAAVMHRAQMQATVAGVDRSGVFIVTDIWRQRHGQWRVWKRHSTPITAGPVSGS